MTSAPDPVFEQPWHAQVFAMTVHLNETGLFTWPEWTVRFSAVLQRHGLARDLDGGDDYFLAWLDTLESLLSDTAGTEPGEIDALRDAWRRAYLDTPHGTPVRLPQRDPSGP
ncbi:nitrile hydratase accessory protein [Cribrihabitans marinus]|uniref:Nitrile hydratase accessory protein n=1 Tax=Cribrihabitans marinus TaxID=1227549 RepID=A0A1H6T7Q7_9RHOB|nr:nitrile hydratase accessory protein [Cribrihabitans marinus]GGH22211.1 nitrile hydratase accessory protein [Cribrihabitans marinus]SEI76123.1 nitrile hydratase accessory protein [Cribrihabitans marinus]